MYILPFFCQSTLTVYNLNNCEAPQDNKDLKRWYKRGGGRGGRKLLPILTTNITTEDEFASPRKIMHAGLPRTVRMDVISEIAGAYQTSCNFSYTKPNKY